MLAGSYDLSAGVTINHPVTLEGAMAGVSADPSRGTGESVLNGPVSPGSSAFTFNTSLVGNVTIEGFTIDGSRLAVPNGSNRVYGMTLDMSDNVMNLQAVPGDANLHIDSSPVTLSDNAVTVHGSSGDSVFWVFSTNSVSITGNTITGDTGDSVMGLHLDTIQGQVSGNQFDGTDTGIFLAGYSGNVQIEDNQFQNLTRGPAAVASGSFATGVQLYADETFVVPVTIYGNLFADVDAGIRTSRCWRHVCWQRSCRQ